MSEIRRFARITAVSLLVAALGACKSAAPGTSSLSTPNAPSPVPTPAQVTGQSENWKVSVSKTEKVAVEADRNSPTASEADKKPQDLLVVSLEAAYLGPSGKVPALIAFVDNSGRRLEIFHATMEAPKDGRHRTMEELQPEFDLLSWLNPRTQKEKAKPRSVTTGETFRFSYDFLDPKGDTFKLVFADVPPILLPKPKEAVRKN